MRWQNQRKKPPPEDRNSISQRAKMFESLELFHGEATPAEARVYARLPRKQKIDGATIELAGNLIGPSCEFAQTLPARIPFVQHRLDDRLLAEAIVPDPCFWTPDLPFLYRAELELRAGGDPAGKIDQTAGIRRLGVRGKSLFFEGKRFVLRGGHRDFEISNLKSEFDRDARRARESWTALVVRSPNDDLCDFASRRGMLLVADLTQVDFGSSKLVPELRRLARWPAVGIAIISGDANLSAEPRDIARNLPLAQKIAAGQPMNLRPWARLAFTEVSDPAEFARKTADCTLPIVAVRRKAHGSIEQSRSAADTLQRDLTSFGDFAGYVV
jgi:hypothetical protein